MQKIDKTHMNGFILTYNLNCNSCLTKIEHIKIPYIYIITTVKRVKWRSFKMWGPEYKKCQSNNLLKKLEHFKNIFGEKVVSCSFYLVTIFFCCCLVAM